MRSTIQLCLGLCFFSMLGSMDPAQLFAAEAAKTLNSDSLGRRIDSFTLQDFRGKSFSLSDFSDKQVIVLCFLGTECPLAKLYGPRLQKLSEKFAERAVAFVGMSSNSQDSVTELAAYARAHELTFPILKDLGQKIADQCGAMRTPEVVVLDRDRKIRYAGRVDAQFTFGTGVGLAQPQPQRGDLELALDELLAGKEISVPATEVKGCLIGHDREAVTNSPVTYCNQISRLIQ